MKNAPRSRQSNLVVQELDQELLIYDLSNNKAYSLNETSAIVYQLSNGERTVKEISEFMSNKLKSEVSEDLVWLALLELQKENLLENHQQLENKFAEIPRREAVKRVGLASLVAFPIISSVVAPPAYAAASAPICPMSGQCFPAGSPICGGANCVGTYPVTTYTAGSNCTAFIGGATLNCVVAVGMFSVDVLIT